MGYDIACLWRDAFISWDEERVLDGTIRYWEKARKAGLPVPDDFGSFYRDVEWMGLQRHLKVMGIFARINYRDGKPRYLGDTPRFARYIRRCCERYDELAPLARLFDQLQDRRRFDAHHRYLVLAVGKVSNWRAFSGIFASKGAPMLEFCRWELLKPSRAGKVGVDGFGNTRHVRSVRRAP